MPSAIKIIEKEYAKNSIIPNTYNLIIIGMKKSSRNILYI